MLAKGSYREFLFDRMIRNRPSAIPDVTREVRALLQGRIRARDAQGLVAALISREPMPWRAWLHTQSWGGHVMQPVLVMRQWKRSYVIMTDGVDVKLSGRDRWLRAGGLARVPLHAITLRGES